MLVTRPRKLVLGSHVRILSPSGPVTPGLLEHAVHTLEGWGLQTSFCESTFERDGYLAGDDAARLSAVQRALDDPSIDAVIFSRGGYGAMRILDQIDWAGLREHPRILCGFSDITALHLAALHHAKVATLHGHVAKSFASQVEDLDALRATLFGERGAEQVSVTPIRSGRTRGPLVGGNLSLVAALAGSRHLPSLEGAVLFLEDVGEQDYRLDRLFTTLRLSPAFAGINGIVLGDFTNCAGTYVAEEQMPQFILKLATELADALGVPAVSDYPAGHDSRNLPLPLGVEVELDADAGTLTFAEEFAL